MIARALILISALTATSAPLGAQSFFNAAGIGLPLDALDGRARALGSVGVGLPGSSLLPADPASSARLPLPGAVISIQPTWADLTREGTSGHRYFRGSRFPLLAAGYPTLGGMATVYATSFLDQGYRGERVVIVDLGGTPTEATDIFEQTGSVGALSVGYSRLLTPTLAVGVTVGRYGGSVFRSLSRQFADTTATAEVIAYGSLGTWSYSGYQLTAGVSADVAGLVRVGASATGSTDLDAQTTGQTAGSDRTFDIPFQLRVGASSELAPGLTLSASGSRADWSGIASDVTSEVRDGAVYAFGAGLELSSGTVFGRTAPLRLGFRRTGLPFSLDGRDVAEQVFAGGLALAMNETQDIVLASVDFAVEKGSRIGGTYRENFWRATVSIKASGF